MADIKSPKLDEGFNEVPLDEGFQEVPVSGDAAPKEDAYSPLGSAAMGGAQGLSLGFADELAGGVRGALAKAQGEEGSLPELYAKYRDLTRSEFEKAKKDNPISYGAGEFGGGVGSVLIPGLGAGKLAKLGVKGAAAIGGLAGLGSSEADLTKGEVGEAVKDTALGAGLGAAGGVVGQKVGRFFTTGEKIEGRLQGLLSNAEKKLESIPADEVKMKVGTAGDKAMDILNGFAEKYSKYPDVDSKKIFEETSERAMNYINEIQNAGNSITKLNQVKREITEYITNHLDPQAYSKTAPDFDKQKTAKLLKSIAGSVKDHIEQLGDVADKGLGSQIKETNRHLAYLINRGKIKEPKSFNLSDLNPKKAAYKTVGNALSSPEGVGAQEKLAGLGEKMRLEKAGYPAGVAGAVTAKEETAGDTDASTLSKAMYHADDDKLNKFVSILGTDPEFEHVTKSLAEAISTGDRNKKNAALFAIAQKAKARELFKGME